MRSKEGASELRNLWSQGFKASLPGLGMLFSGMGAGVLVCLSRVPPREGAHIHCSGDSGMALP